MFPSLVSLSTFSFSVRFFQSARLGNVSFLFSDFVPEDSPFLDVSLPFPLSFGYGLTSLSALVSFSNCSLSPPIDSSLSNHSSSVSTGPPATIRCLIVVGIFPLILFLRSSPV